MLLEASLVITLASRIIDRTPLCPIEDIRVEDIGDRGFAHSDGYIVLPPKRDLWFKHRIIHEAVHVNDFREGWSKDPIWGKAPFATDYAATNAYEDLAETMTLYIRGMDFMIPEEKREKVALYLSQLECD